MLSHGRRFFRLLEHTTNTNCTLFTMQHSTADVPTTWDEFFRYEVKNNESNENPTMVIARERGVAAEKEVSEAERAEVNRLARHKKEVSEQIAADMSAAEASEAQQQASSGAALEESEAVGTATPTAALAALPLSGPLVVLLGSVATSDRKIGALEATIREVEELLLSREEACAQLGREVSLARQDAASLEQEAEQHRRILEEQDALWLTLQESRRKLMDEFHAETFEHRHAALDADGLLLTARSELSTVCTVNDVSEQTLPKGEPAEACGRRVLALSAPGAVHGESCE
jgi:hypothetical protein